MRLGLIADIHGNKLALDAVLEQLDYWQIDQILCLGDVATLGPDPGGVVRTLRERQIPAVMGNTDAWLFNPDRNDLYFSDLTYWTLDQLSEEDLDYLRYLPSATTVPLTDQISLYAFHGSPRSYDDVLSASTPEPTLIETFHTRSQQIYAGGHTHVQHLRRFEQRHFINPGSVGMPGIGPMYVSGTGVRGISLEEVTETLGENFRRSFGIGDPKPGFEEPDPLPMMSEIAQNKVVDWAEFATIEANDDRALAFSFYRIPLDLNALFESADASGMPHLDWWKSFWAQPPAQK